MLVDLVFLAAVVGLLIAIYKFKFSSESLNQSIEEAARASRLAKEKEEASKKAKEEAEQIVEKEEKVETRPNSEDEGWQNDSGDEGSDDQEGDMRKKWRKEQKQKEKQQRKEAHEQYLQQQKEKRQKYEKESQERERLQEERRRKEEEIIEQLREEERKRKEEEFNKWKNMFSVEEVGKEKLSQEEEKKKIQAFNRQLVTILQKNKLSLLEDLSHKFKMTTKEIVEKIKQLQKDNLISGIFDERGKYLVIEQSQWNAVKNYILARGRVKKTDIMVQCAKIIKIPQNVEQDLLKLITEEQEKQAQ